jgi:Tfp pilus assembly protein PilO
MANLNLDINTILNKLNLKDQKQIVVVVAALFLTYFFGNKILTSNKTEIANIKSKIDSYHQIKDSANEINILSSELEKFKDVGWATKESDEIMGSVNELANKHSVEILNFSPGALRNENNYSVFSMSLNIRSDYFSLLRFLSEIEELKALTKITYLQLNPEGPSSEAGYEPMVGVNLSMDAYILSKRN